MYKLCKTEQSALRQRELEQGLLALMLQHRYEDITVSDLCEYLQIPRKSFYRYFSSKEGALYALIDHTMLEYEGLDTNLRVGINTDLRKSLEDFFVFWQERSDLLDALSKSGMIGFLLERALNYAHSTPVAGLFSSEADKWEKTHLINFTLCGLMTMIVNWHRSGFRDSVTDLAGVALRLVSRPLFPYTAV